MNHFLLISLISGLQSGAYFALWQNELISAGFTMSSIALVVTVQTVVSTVLDIPTGIFADKMGHKRTTVLGLLVDCLAFLIPAIYPSPASLVTGVLLIGVAGALISGAQESWITDVQAAQGASATTRTFIERDQISRIGMISGALAIPFLVAHVLPAVSPWLIFFLLASIVLGIAVVTPNAPPESHFENPFHASELRRLGTLLGHPTFRVILGTYFFFGVTDGLSGTTFWPRVRELGITDLATFGTIQACMSLSRLSGLEIWKRFFDVERRSVIVVSLIGSGVLFGLFGLINNPGAALVVWMARIGVISVYFSAVQAWTLSIPELKPIKATALSAAGVIGALGAVVGSSAVAVLGPKLGANRFFEIGGLITIGLGFVLAVLVVGRVSSRKAIQSH